MKIKWTGILFIVIVVVAAIYMLTSTNGTLSKRSSDFSIENTDEITSIFIYDGKQELLLEKGDLTWTVNKKYQVKDWNIRNFLTALNRLNVLAPVSKKENDQVRMLLHEDGILVKIFKGKRVIKSYYVSKPEMNKAKTYMLMKKSKQAYVVGIPMFNGLVSDLYLADETYWRDKVIFNYKPQDIKEISLEYQDIKKSFVASNYNDGSFELSSMDKSLTDFNVEQLAKYFTYFQNINFESVLVNQSQDYVDSVLSSEPFVSVIVTDFNKKSKQLKLYRKPAENELDEFGEKARFDYNKAYGILNNSNEIILIPYYNIDPILKEIDYFR